MIWHAVGAAVEGVDGIFKANLGGEHGSFQSMGQVGLDVVSGIETHGARWMTGRKD